MKEPKVGRQGVNISESSIERRRAQRLNINCDVELTATLAILDSEIEPTLDSLIFLGRTWDLSAAGLSFILPSIVIDEKCCNDRTRLRVRLHLPTGSVQLEVNPVRCVHINLEDRPTGYFMAAQILSIDDQRDVYDSYLRSAIK